MGDGPMTFGELVMLKRRSLGLKQGPFGDLVGVSRAAVIGWEKGHAFPREDKYRQLSAVLDVPVHEIVQLVSEDKIRRSDEIPESKRSPAPTVIDRNVAGIEQPAGKLPVISWSQAAQWGEKLNAKDLGDTVEWVTSPYPGEYFLRVVGVSMYNPAGEPSFRDGDLISISTQHAPEHRKFVLVMRHGEAVPTFKQYRSEER